MIREFNNLIKDVQKRTDNFVGRFIRHERNRQEEENNFKVLYLEASIQYETVKYFFDEFAKILNEGYKGPILIMIDSFGGEINSAISIVNLLQSVDNEIFTCVYRRCGSAANPIYLSVDYDHRFATEEACFLIHPPAFESTNGVMTIDEAISRKNMLSGISKDQVSFIVSKTSIPEEIVKKAFCDIDTEIIINANEFEKYKIGNIINNYEEIKELTDYKLGIKKDYKNKFEYLKLLENASLYSMDVEEKNYERRTNMFYQNDDILLIPIYSFQIKNSYFCESVYSNLKFSNKRVIIVVFGSLSKETLQLLLAAKPEDRYIFSDVFYEPEVDKVYAIDKKRLQPHDLESMIRHVDFSNDLLKKSLLENTDLVESEVDDFISSYCNAKSLEEKGIAKVISSLNEIEL